LTVAIVAAAGLFGQSKRPVRSLGTWRGLPVAAALEGNFGGSQKIQIDTNTSAVGVIRVANKTDKQDAEWETGVLVPMIDLPVVASLALDSWTVSDFLHQPSY
jgi:hypothetical protein